MCVLARMTAIQNIIYLQVSQSHDKIQSYFIFIILENTMQKARRTDPVLECMSSLQTTVKGAPSGLLPSEEPMWELPASALSSLFPGIAIPEFENDSANKKIDVTPEMQARWREDNEREKSLKLADTIASEYDTVMAQLTPMNDAQLENQQEELQRCGYVQYVANHLVVMHRAQEEGQTKRAEEELLKIKNLNLEITSQKDLQGIKDEISQQITFANISANSQYRALLEQCIAPYNAKLKSYTVSATAARISCLEVAAEKNERAKARHLQEAVEKVEEVADAAARAAREERRAQEIADRLAREKTRAAERAKQMKPKNDFLDLLGSIRRVMETNCSVLEKFKSNTDKRSLEHLKKEIVGNIKSMRDTLDTILEGNKNKNRIQILKTNVTSLDELKNELSSIHIDSTFKKNHGLTQFASKLEENLTEEDIKRLEKTFPGLSQLKAALKGEVNEANTKVLNTAHEKLEAKFKLIQEEQETLLTHMKALEKLHQMVEKRKEEVDEYRTTKKNEKFPLSDEDNKRIDVLVAKTNDMIKDIEEGTPQPQPTRIQTVATPAPSQRVAPLGRRDRAAEPATPAREDTVTVHVQPDCGEAQLPKKRISKQERQRIFQEKWAKEIEERKINSEKKARDKARDVANARTVQDIRNGLVPVPLRTTMEEPKVMLEYSTLLKMHLEQFNSIIQQLKTKLQNGQTWSIKEKLALLGSFAEVSELVMHETRDIAIKEVARRERNAIYKDPAVQEIDDVQLLDMSERWLLFLQTKVLGYFTDEAAVLRTIDSHPLLQGKKLIQPLYDLGKKLDIPLKGNAANRKSQIAEKVDVEKTRQCINSMRSYLIEHCEQNPESEIVHTAAIHFFWAILDATYVHLKAAKNANMPGAPDALRELKSLTPYFSKITGYTTVHEQGVLARHPQTRLELLNLLYRFEKTDENPLSTGAVTSDAELLFSRGTGIQSLDAKTKAEAECNQGLFKLLDRDTSDYAIEYFSELLATVNANVKDRNGRTLLLAACQNPNTPKEVIEILLQQDADPNAAIKYSHQPGDRQPLFTDYTCVAFAALNGRADIIELFSENSKKPVTPVTWTQAHGLYSECKNGNSEEAEMKALLEQRSAQGEARFQASKK